ncbi:leucyl aminopeptidase [Silicimonas algicola]|uniref:Probable cytosol aminopeptidase n=1 Tax=Silicimonas algicola TaxID=1826607 RepID=A0A316GS99_9RHOB|nr:leucyl aminopeptidase [Silicimonas algicola]AZQ67697.1 leucyl aminopeptidase [Silicimonas algicola]PWK57897.1 leucyl aminopeptidase [Silicimonas algicola]
MTDLPQLDFTDADLDRIADTEGRIVVFVPEDGTLDKFGRRIDKLTRGALKRFAESEAFGKMKDGSAHLMSWPSGLAAEAVQVIRLDRKTKGEAARKAGAAIGAALGPKGALVLGGGLRGLDDVVLAALLRCYAFDAYLSKKADAHGTLTVMGASEAAQDSARAQAALAEGVYFTRDLVNEPSNILTTTEFAERLKGLAKLGVKVEVLEEADLDKLGMRTLLAVGQGSESPSKVVVMTWSGGGDEKPLALVGKGVVFDSGGISIKPAVGMEDMTMDMGGAGTVAGVMRALALRKARANVVAIVGLVENMPDGKAQRPGDVVVSMKGDTVEVVNTDAEGRLVLCDIMWYVQDRFEPTAMIDLATLTGAVIIALGHEMAGVYSNDDALAKAFLNAAEAEGEGAWRMPLGKGYDEQIKSRVADMKNTGGRPAGSITAAQFLARFVKDGTPWIHLDIAGVASLKTSTTLAPKGATGWGVLALDRLVRDRYEPKPEPQPEPAPEETDGAEE